MKVKEWWHHRWHECIMSYRLGVHYVTRTQWARVHYTSVYFSPMTHYSSMYNIDYNIHTGIVRPSFTARVRVACLCVDIDNHVDQGYDQAEWGQHDRKRALAKRPRKDMERYNTVAFQSQKKERKKERKRKKQTNKRDRNQIARRKMVPSLKS